MLADYALLVLSLFLSKICFRDKKTAVHDSDCIHRIITQIKENIF